MMASSINDLPNRAPADTIGSNEAERLLALAASALQSLFRSDAKLGAHPAGASVASCVSVFVTLRRNSLLRGCIGVIEAHRELEDAVVYCTIAAARNDPRFPRLEAQELAGLKIEISILGSFEPIQHPDQIEIGVHGLYIEKGPRSGLLLPQVAAVRGLTPIAFLELTCRKAGLDKDAWRSGSTMRIFGARVVSTRLP